LIKLSFWIEKDYGVHLLESPLSRDQQAFEGKKQYRSMLRLLTRQCSIGGFAALGRL
jgi:hypothetical protein